MICHNEQSRLAGARHRGSASPAHRTWQESKGPYLQVCCEHDLGHMVSQLGRAQPLLRLRVCRHIRCSSATCRLVANAQRAQGNMHACE